MPHDPFTPLTRRRLVQQGALGAAVAGVGVVGLEGVASAADDVLPELRRSTYLSLTSTAFEADGVALELLGVEDLPVATHLPALIDRDDAFTLRFRGALSASDMPRTFSHPEIGTFALFVSPVERSGDHVAIVDRTVRLPGLTPQGAPGPVVEGERAKDAAVAAAPAPPAAATAAKTRRRPRLRRVTARRRGRRVIADLTFAERPRLRTVRVVLVRDGVPIGRVTARVRHHRARLVIGARTLPRRGAYELRIVAVDRRHRLSRLTAPLDLA